jgi:GxxExxY protein
VNPPFAVELLARRVTQDEPRDTIRAAALAWAPPTALCGKNSTAKYANHAKASLGRGEITFTGSVIALYFGTMKAEIIFREESYRITGACLEVYREKGCGFLEAVYQECVEIELGLQGIPFVAQKPLALDYKTRPLRTRYEPDFVCYEKIILELKAAKELTDQDRAQVQNYLKATKFQLGLLVNFGHYPKLQVERIVNTRGRYGKDATA